MKHQWLAYLIVGLLSIGAGVAIAGLPDSVSGGTTIIPPSTTLAVEPTLPETTGATTTVSPTTEPDATVPNTTVAPTTLPSTTLPSTTLPSTTLPPTVPDATVADTTDSAPTDLPDRSELSTIVANGANVAGAAGRNVERLQAIGYTDIAPRNGTGIAEFTTIYFADGFEAAALRLADDLELPPFSVEPIAAMPMVIDLPDGVELVAFIGLDRA